MLIDLAGTNCVHNSLVLTCEFMYNNQVSYCGMNVARFSSNREYILYESV